MKLKLVSILLVCLMASSAFATNTWVGPSGSWGNGALWGSGLPDGSTAQGDLKICKNNVTSCDLDVAAGTFNNGKVILGGNSSYNIAFNIKTGGSITIGTEFRIGDSGVGGQGPYGKAIQTGGSVVMINTGKLEIGYKVNGRGIYTISGGTISSTGGMAVGSSVGKSGGESGGIGTFTIQGNGPSISVGSLYVGTGDPTGFYTGTGTLEFQIVNGTVTAIQAGNVYIDPINASASVANLTVSITSGTPAGDIILVNNTGNNPVYGAFDNAAWDSTVTVGTTNYILTKVYNASTGSHTGGNDIALIPTSITTSMPATNTGDLLIAAVTTDGSTTISTPSGWTPINQGSDDGGQVTLGAWYKVAVASEPAPIFNWTGVRQAYGWIMRFSGQAASNPINTSNSGQSFGTATPSSPPVTTTVKNCLILRLGAFDDNSITINNPTLLSGHTTITADASGGVAGGIVSGGAGYIKQAAIGSSGNSNFSLLSAKAARMLTIAIAPANTDSADEIKP